MPMVRMHINQPVGMWVGIDGVRGDEMRSGDKVPKMAIDGIDEEGFAIRVPIMAPRVHGSVSHHLDDFASRMIPPHPAADRNSFGGARAGAAEFSGSRGPTAAIQPSIGSPMKPIGKVVVIVSGDRKTIHYHLGRTI